VTTVEYCRPCKLEVQGVWRCSTEHSAVAYYELRWLSKVVVSTHTHTYTPWFGGQINGPKALMQQQAQHTTGPLPSPGLCFTAAQYQASNRSSLNRKSATDSYIRPFWRSCQQRSAQLSQTPPATSTEPFTDPFKCTTRSPGVLVRQGRSLEPLRSRAGLLGSERWRGLLRHVFVKSIQMSESSSSGEALC